LANRKSSAGAQSQEDQDGWTAMWEMASGNRRALRAFSMPKAATRRRA
jgi:hypothetical protein